MSTLRRALATLASIAHDNGLGRTFSPRDYWSTPFPAPARKDQQ
jgi:hypothetical protein